MLKKGLAYVLALGAVLAIVYCIGSAIHLMTMLWVLLGIAALVVTGMFFLPGRVRRVFRAAVVCVGALAFAAVAFFALRDTSYGITGNSFLDGETLSGKHVLVVVPHQDDETNVAYAAITAYKQAGSRVSIVYMTNGDYFDKAPERIKEALAVAARYGIDAADVYFLGYGDKWQDTHIYNLPSDEVATSHAGYTQTYGTQTQADYRTQTTGTAAAYTRGNLCADMKSVIETLRADVIISNECDDHADHRACSLFFDRAMGQILREDATYRPLVLKGFAYCTAWTAPEDFYGDLLLSSTAGEEDVVPFDWALRLRFPIPQNMRAYTLHSSAIMPLLKAHASQDARDKAEGILSGDEVFFVRSTNNLAWQATVTSDGGVPELLHDFMLRDSTNININADEMAWDSGIFLGKSVTYTWDTPVDIETIVTYDYPSVDNNVIAAQATYVSAAGEGSFPLEESRADGAQTITQANLNGVTRLTIEIMDIEGDSAGYTEIELLPPVTQALQILKITNAAQDFLYQLPLESETQSEFSLYTYPAMQLPAAEVTLRTESGTDVAGAVYEDGVIYVPALEKGNYILCVRVGDAYDEVRLMVGKSLWIEEISQKTEIVLNKVRKLFSGTQKPARETAEGSEADGGDPFGEDDEEWEE